MIVFGQRTLAHSLLLAGSFALGLNFILYSVFGLEAIRVPIRIAALGMFVLSALFDFRSLKFDVLFLPMIGLAVLSLMLNGLDALNMLAVLLFVLAASPYSLSEVLSDLLKCFVAIAIIYAFAVVAGFVSLTSYVMDGRVRNTLGFVNVNAAALFFFSMLLLLAKERRRAWMVNCGVALAFVFLFILTNTRSLLLGAGVYYASYILFRFMGKGKTPSRLRGAVGLMVLYTLIVIAFSLPLLAGTEFDQALSWRPTLFHESLAEFTPFDWLFGSSSFEEVDNSFIVIMGHYGVLFLACAIAILHKSILRCSECGHAWSYSFLLSVLACGSIESFIYRPELIVTLAFWFVAFNSTSSAKQVTESGDLRYG